MAMNMPGAAGLPSNGVSPGRGTAVRRNSIRELNRVSARTVRLSSWLLTSQPRWPSG